MSWDRQIWFPMNKQGFKDAEKYLKGRGDLHLPPNFFNNNDGFTVVQTANYYSQNRGGGQLECLPIDR